MPLEEEYSDKAVIKTDFEGGYSASRARFTRLKRKFILHYSTLSMDNKKILEELIDVTKGAASFEWFHPELQSDIKVRFGTLPKFSKVVDTATGRYETQIVLEEI